MSDRDRATSASDATVESRITKVLERIRPALRSDGGDIEFLGIDEAGVVSVRFQGACVGCPSSAMTLVMGIERNLKDQVPEVTSVVAV